MIINSNNNFDNFQQSYKNKCLNNQVDISKINPIKCIQKMKNKKYGENNKSDNSMNIHVINHSGKTIHYKNK